MNSERRYDRDEIERIFERAMQPDDDAAHPDASGLTLSELKEIAREVGVPAERVEAVALEVARERGGADPAPTRAGGDPIGGRPSRLDRLLTRGPLPIRVEHDAPLARTPTDAEWEDMVDELRDAFRARGSVRAYGNVREWSNGNLQVVLESGRESGHVRMSTVKGSARTLGGVGLAMLGLGGLIALAEPGGGATGLLFGGAATLVAGSWELPGWARRRHRQMRAIAEGWQRRLARPSTDDDTAGPV